MDSSWKLWARTNEAVGGVVAAYAATVGRAPTVEELVSDLERLAASHEAANRALTNMALSLSDALDRLCMSQSELAQDRVRHRVRSAKIKELEQLELEHKERIADLEKQLAR